MKEATQNVPLESLDDSVFIPLEAQEAEAMIGGTCTGGACSRNPYTGRCVDWSDLES
jgi:hypothetical protein